MFASINIILVFEKHQKGMVPKKLTINYIYNTLIDEKNKSNSTESPFFSSGVLNVIPSGQHTLNQIKNFQSNVCVRNII